MAKYRRVFAISGVKNRLHVISSPGIDIKIESNEFFLRIIDKNTLFGLWQYKIKDVSVSLRRVTELMFIRR